jgi:hypothetical protein
VGSTTTSTCWWFLAAARSMVGPPMSMFSMHAEKSAPLATVCQAPPESGLVRPRLGSGLGAHPDPLLIASVLPVPCVGGWAFVQQPVRATVSAPPGYTRTEGGVHIAESSAFNHRERCQTAGSQHCSTLLDLFSVVGGQLSALPLLLVLSPRTQQSGSRTPADSGLTGSGVVHVR